MRGKIAKLFRKVVRNTVVKSIPTFYIEHPTTGQRLLGKCDRKRYKKLKEIFKC